LNFVVPSAAPWPEKMWGMRLGRKIDMLRKQPDYKHDFPDRYEKLVALGFNWQQEVFDEWDLIYKALNAYKQLEGNTRVPARFEVPRSSPWPEECYDLKLGMRVASIRSVGRYVKDFPDRIQQLDEMGFEWRLRVSQMKEEASNEEYNLVVEALTIYKQQFGSIAEIPNTYVVPSNEMWPERCRGLPLGERVNKIQMYETYIKDNAERRAELSALGLPFRTTSAERWNNVFGALELYKELHGHLNVPLNFVIPSEAPWDERVWGLRLGNRVGTIRSQGSLIKGEPSRRKQLEDLGFEFDQMAARAKRGRKSEKDLELAEELRWGMNLRKEELLEDARYYVRRGEDLSATDVRSGSKYNEEQTEEEEEIVWPVHSAELPYPSLPERERESLYYTEGLFEAEGWYDCSPGAEADPFVQMEIMSSMEKEYFDKKPMESAKLFNLHYPVYLQKAFKEKVRDLQKEADEPSARNVGRQPPRDYMINSYWMTPEEKELVAEQGYVWDEFGEGFTWEEVIVALRLFKKLEGHLDVPEDFQVPADLEWPDEFANMPLGAFVVGFRNGDIDAKFHKERWQILDELEFDWKEEEYKDQYLYFNWNKLVTGLYSLVKIKGDSLVDLDYTFPPVEPWPVSLYGLEIGKMINMARWQKYTLWYKYPDRRMLLRDLEFWWGPPDLDIIRAELNPETFEYLEQKRQYHLDRDVI